MKLTIHNYAEMLAFITGVLVYTRIKIPALKWLVYFLGLTLLVELAGLYLPKAFIIAHSSEIYNVFIGIQEVFFLICFITIIQKEKKKKAIRLMLYSYLAFWVINQVAIQGINRLNYLTYLLGALFIIIAACLYFFELLEAESVDLIFKNSLFWFSAAALFFFTSTFFYFSLWYFLVEQSLDKKGNLFVILMQVINVIFYLFIIVSFVCQGKEQKSS